MVKPNSRDAANLKRYGDMKMAKKDKVVDLLGTGQTLKENRDAVLERTAKTGF